MTTDRVFAWPEVRFPNLPELEASLIGSVLLDNSLLDRVANVVTADEFHDPLFARAWFEITEAVRAGRVARWQTIGQTLADQDKDEGTVADELRVLTETAVPLHAEEHAQMIRNAADQRRLMAVSRSLLEDAAQGGSEPAAELAARYASDLHKIGFGLAEWEDFGTVGERGIANIASPNPVYPTGIACLDHRLMGGLMQGKLYGLAARHKVGKSMLLTTIAYNIATGPQPCGIVDLTLEMSPEERWRRTVARDIGVNEARLALAKSRGEMELVQSASEANEKLRNRGMYLLGRPGCSLDEMRTIVARAGMSDKIQGVIVDYLQLLTGKLRGQSTAEFLDEAAQALANAARRYGLWIIAAAQLNQEGNVRGSEGLLNACDMALFLHKVEREQHVHAWLEMKASRFTPAKDIGSEAAPPLYMDYTVGPHFRETEFR
jgi:replicative DNA helicase